MEDSLIWLDMPAVGANTPEGIAFHASRRLRAPAAPSAHHSNSTSPFLPMWPKKSTPKIA